MKVKDFKERMSVVHVLLLGWRNVTINDLRNKPWICFLRGAAKSLSDLADDLERDIMLDDK